MQVGFFLGEGGNPQREDSSLGLTTRKLKSTQGGLDIPPVINNQREDSSLGLNI